jgi:hypothetical protein
VGVVGPKNGDKSPDYELALKRLATNFRLSLDKSLSPFTMSLYLQLLCNSD